MTGASSGIGRGIAVTCSKMGATVIINGRNIARLQETESLMESDSAIIKSGDLTETATLASNVGELPKLDGVVHCAGL